MHYRQHDYFPSEAANADLAMREKWADRWKSLGKLHTNHEDTPIWPVVRDACKPGRGRILEAGCGIPDWVDFLDKKGFVAIGLDYVLSPLQIGKGQIASLRLVNGDLRHLPFRHESFDYILSIGAIEHDPEGPERTLVEMHRVLAPTGRLLCSAPCLNLKRQVALPWLVLRDWLKRREMLRRLAGKTESFRFYQYVWSPSEYRRILRQCGFETIALRAYGETAETRLGRFVARRIGKVLQFYAPHMMMAICRKATP